MEEESTQQMTQPSTQDIVDPRRAGRSNSGLTQDDVSDVICILHPSSPAAFRVVNFMAMANQQHILQNNEFNDLQHTPTLGTASEAETIIVASSGRENARDLALRFSSSVIDPALGFCFGRHPHKCDINLDHENQQKRVSNTHFRIFVNDSGILMLEDMSTNGTVVDGFTLGGRKRTEHHPKTTMLNFGSIIHILGDTPDGTIKFIVTIPSRDGHREEYTAKFQKYMQHKCIAEQRAHQARQGPPMPEVFAKGMLAAPLTGPPNAKHIPTFNAPVIHSNYGMHWDGGDEFSCTGVLGKGAFATVYQLARRIDGELFAAKELDKKRVMKNGIMDHRIENEMQIMKALKHDNIVKYIDYVETEQYLYIVMEFVPCGDLSGYMSSHKTLPEHMAKTMTRQMMHALAYLHQKDITHRDIKPDNILIASEDPFVCKLTDFGLSKMVKNNETFLKTFCGTLLYCAPEVFPHYSDYAVGNKPKRRRQGSSNSSSKRSYSQLVDIWSYAAVLWYVLCGKPPFEGVVDPAGRGMFNQIMQTKLDVALLHKHHISNECIDLLEQMLDIDPYTRPSELDCLNHPWLIEGSALQGYNTVSNGLAAIEEGEEGLDASQLSIRDRLDDYGSYDDDSDSSFGERLMNGPNKRFKSQSLLGPADLNQDFTSYSAETPLHLMVNQARGDNLVPAPYRSNKLFGEISQPASQSSDVLGIGIQVGLTSTPDIALEDATIPDAQTNVTSAHQTTDQVPTATEMIVQADAVPRPPLDEEAQGPVNNLALVAANSVQPAVAKPITSSLLGTEDIFKDMNMASPGHQTPENARTPHGSMDTPQGNQRSEQNDETPRPRQTKFSRQIELPIPASLFYDPSDPNTHNTEYASKVSGISFLGQDIVSEIDANTLPPTIVASFQSREGSNSIEQGNTIYPLLPPLDSKERSLGSSVTSAASSNEFAKPAPLLGRLTTTPDSFMQISLNLTRRRTTWGRLPSNTHVYRDAQDTRIPKLALDLWFHARGVEEAEQSGKDLSQLDGLVAILRTSSRGGVYVNGVKLNQMDEENKLLYGEVRTGDEICVWTQADGRNTLKFVCEFFYGLSAKPRKAGERFIAKSSPSTTTTSASTSTTTDQLILGEGPDAQTAQTSTE